MARCCKCGKGRADEQRRDVLDVSPRLTLVSHLTLVPRHSPGVTSVTVDLAANSAEVIGLPTMSYAELVNAVRTVGKDARLL